MSSGIEIISLSKGGDRPQEIFFIYPAYVIALNNPPTYCMESKCASFSRTFWL